MKNWKLDVANFEKEIEEDLRPIINRILSKRKGRKLKPIAKKSKKSTNSKSKN